MEGEFGGQPSQPVVGFLVERVDVHGALESFDGALSVPPPLP